eukprot:IDg3318t1
MRGHNKDAFHMVSWMGHEYVDNNFAARTNIINSIPLLAAGELVFKIDKLEQGDSPTRRQVLRPKKSLCLSSKSSSQILPACPVSSSVVTPTKNACGMGKNVVCERSVRSSTIYFQDFLRSRLARSCYSFPTNF